MANLLETTKALLADRPRSLTLPALADQAGVKPDWLAKFSQGKIDNPRVLGLQKLHDYLAALRAE